MSPADLTMLQGLSVLVVEDEPLIAMALSDELEAAGALVLGPATSVESALVEIANRNPAAAVLDLDLQGQLVTPVADALAARSVPFVLTTGHDSEALPAQYAPVPKCAKPVPAGEVLALLCSALQTPR